MRLFQVHTANVLNLDVFRCFRFFSQKQVVLNFEASDVGLKIFLMAKLLCGRYRNYINVLSFNNTFL